MGECAVRKVTAVTLMMLVLTGVLSGQVLAADNSGIRPSVAVSPMADGSGIRPTGDVSLMADNSGIRPN